MARSELLLKPRKSADGLIHKVTPESAGWTYVGFEARDLKSGDRLAKTSPRSARGLASRWSSKVLRVAKKALGSSSSFASDWCERIGTCARSGSRE